MSPEERETRAREAKSFIEHPLFEQGVTGLENAYLKVLDNSPDRDIQYECWVARRILREFRQRFVAIISDGKMATLELDEKKRRNSGR